MEAQLVPPPKTELELLLAFVDEPFACLRDTLLRLTTEPGDDLQQLLPHRWNAALES